MNKQSLNRVVKRKKPKNRAMANKGKASETLLDRVNAQYSAKGIADVKKLPTPIHIMKVTGSKVEGIRLKGYLVDYIGVCNGTAIAFDMKECKAASFPLQNIESHQFEMLKSWYQKGAHSFLVVYMERLDSYFRLPFEVLNEAWETMLNGGRKSIEQRIFIEQCIRLKPENGLLLDYLTGLY